LEILAILAGGMLAGLIGALLGLGGGIVAVPFVNLVMGVPMHVAAGAGLISTLSVSCGAAGRYLRHGDLVDVEQAFRIELFAAAGGLFGGIAVGWLSGPVLQVLFSVTMVYAAVHIIRTAGSKEEKLAPGEVPAARRLLAFGACFVAGVMSGFFGIGGGIVIVPVLHLVMSLPFKKATATSNFMMGMTAVPALCGFIARDQLDLTVACPLAAGVLIGATLGARLMPRLRTSLLKSIFALALVAAAFEMARKGISAW